MPLLETLIAGVGTSVASSILKMWLKDEPIGAAVGNSVISILGGKIKDVRKRNATARQLDEIGERTAESVLVMLDKEYGDMPEDRLEFVSNAASETISNTPITAELLADRNLQPELLASHFLYRSGAEGGSPGLAGIEGGVISFSEPEQETYRRILEHASQLIVDIASQLPLFSERVLGEILKRESDMVEKADRIIDGMDRLLAAQTGEYPDDERFETAYRSACIRRFDHLELFGVDLQESNKRYKLSVAYITLDVEKKQKQSSGISSERIDKHAKNHESMPVDTALASTNRLFVRGVAGSGKTTLLQWTAVFAAGRDHKGDLEAFNNFVPFLIKLRDYSGTLLPGPEEFPAAISTALAGKPENWVHRKLYSGTAIVMVDGIDEVAENQRHEVSAWLADLTHQYPDTRFIVTSRPHAAQEDWLKSKGFVEASLQQMGRNDIYEFVEKWHDAVCDGISEPDGRNELKPLANALLDRLRSDSALFNLAVSPLLCAILCALHRDRKQDLPRDRVELYRACIEMFFRRDRERSVSMKGYVELTDRQKLRLLQKYAWWLIKNGKSSSSLSETDEYFQSQLSRLTEQPNKGSGLEVRRLMIERVGILRQLSTDKIDFPHRTFQEYLAAHEAVADDDLLLLAKYAHEDQWREVAVLAAGLIKNETKAANFINALLGEGEKDTTHRATLYIVAAAAFESIIGLPVGNRLQDEINQRLMLIVPPKNFTAAKELVAGGDLVVPHLRYNSKWRTEEAVAAVRSLWLIGTETAAEAIFGYTIDSREVVFEEVQNAISNLREDLAEILSPNAFRGFKNVTRLSFARCSVHDLSGIGDCVNLRRLNLKYTPISDISALVDCPTLQSLNIESTQVTDLSALATSTSLQSLDLGSTEVNDISGLSNCSSLQSLDLRNTPVEDIIALANCRSLKTLVLWGTRVSDISALATCPSLQTLDLRSTPVCDVSPLAACESLQTLYIENTHVRDVSALSACTSLQKFDLRNTPVSDISALAECPSLNILQLWGTNVSDVSSLAASNTLRWLQLPQGQSLGSRTEISQYLKKLQASSSKK